MLRCGVKSENSSGIDESIKLKISWKINKFLSSESTEWKPRNITVYVGDSVWFHCDARRVPRFPFKVAWFKRGQGSKMLDKKRFRVIANGSIHITDIRLNDEGKYFCITKKNFKQTFGTRYLLVRGKPCQSYFGIFLNVTKEPLNFVQGVTSRLRNPYAGKFGIGFIKVVSSNQ